MKNRKKFKLTYKQTKLLLALFVAILVITYIIIGFICSQQLTDRVLIVITGLMLAYVSSLPCAISLKLMGFCSNAEQQKITELLSKDTYTEVLFFPPIDKTSFQMATEILEAEGCRFYAKLDKNNDILLVVKDKRDDEVYSSILTNYLYFLSNFKPKN